MLSLVPAAIERYALARKVHDGRRVTNVILTARKGVTLVRRRRS